MAYEDLMIIGHIEEADLPLVHKLPDRVTFTVISDE